MRRTRIDRLEPEEVNRALHALSDDLDTLDEKLEQLRAGTLAFTGDVDFGGFRGTNVGTAESDDDSITLAELAERILDIEDEEIALETSNAEGTGGSAKGRRLARRTSRLKDLALEQALQLLDSVVDGGVVFGADDGGGGVELQTDSANFFWDDTNERLGLLTNAPSDTLHIAGAGTLRLEAITAGSVLFAGASGVVSEDNANLFWDDASDFFGVRTASPGSPLHVVGHSGVEASPAVGSSDVVAIFQNGNPVGNPSAGIEIVGNSNASAQISLGWEGNKDSGRINYRNSIEAMGLFTADARHVSISADGHIQMGQAAALDPGTGANIPRVHIHDQGGSITFPSIAGEAGQALMVQKDNLVGDAVAMFLVCGTSGTDSILFGDSDAVRRGSLEYNNATEAMTLGTAGSTRVTIDATGQVGVATAPSAGLHYLGDELRLERNSTSSTFIDFYDSGGLVGRISADNGGFFDLRVAAAANLGFRIEDSSENCVIPKFLKVDGTGGGSVGTVPLSVGATEQFQVASDGDLQVIKSVSYDWPAANAAGILLNDGAGNLSWTVAGTGIDHGGLAGLADDDHTQYILADGTRALTAAWDAGSFQIRAETFQSDVTTGTAPLTIASTTVVSNLNVDKVDGRDEGEFALLAGRAGGQILRGGTAAGDDLDLRASAASDYTGAVLIGKGAGDYGTAEAVCADLWPDGITFGFSANDIAALRLSSTLTQDANAIAGLPNVHFAEAAYTHTIASGVSTPSGDLVFSAIPTLTNPLATAASGGGCFAYISRPVFSSTGGSTLTTGSNLTTGFLSSYNIGSSVTAPTYAHYAVGSSSYGGLNTVLSGTLTTETVLDCGTLRGSTQLTVVSGNASAELRHAGPGVYGANAAPTNSSVGLEVQSTTLAFLAPRMTTTQRNALTAVNGMIIYNTTTSQMEGYIGGAWTAM